jgi:hypothetical protein
MEFMAGGSLAEVLGQYVFGIEMTEAHIANICREVRFYFISTFT